MSIKRIAFGSNPDKKQINLYAQYLDGKKSFLITHDRKRIAGYLNFGAAKAKFDALCAGESLTIEKKKHQWEEEADNIEQNPSIVPQHISLQTLATLARRIAERKGISLKHCQAISTVGNAVGSENIPKDSASFTAWLQDSLGKVTDGIESQANLKMRTTLFLQVFKIVFVYPTALHPWSKFAELVVSQVKFTKAIQKNSLKEIENRPCFTRTEIEGCLKSCPTFNDALLVCLYLATGCRGGEAEKINISCLTHDSCLDMSKIVTKTKINRRPPASISIGAIIAALADIKSKDKPIIPKNYDRKRFRATTATYLILAGISALDVAVRLNHSSIAMVVEHYSKSAPSDMKAGQSLINYLDLPKYNISGHIITDNTWDKYVLYLVLMQAKRFEVDVRGYILAILKNTQKESKQNVVSF